MLLRLERRRRYVCALLIVFASAGRQLATAEEIYPVVGASPAYDESATTVAVLEITAAEMLPEALPTNSITLDDVLNLARQNHPRLRQAAAEIERARGEAVQAGLYPNPTFDSGSPNLQLAGSASLYTGGVTQEFVRGGKLRLSQAAAWQRVAALQMQYFAEQNDLERDVRLLFLNLLADQMRLELLSGLTELLLSAEQATERLFEAGQTSRTDVLLVRTQRREAQASVEALTQEIVGRKRRLAALIGRPGMPIDRLEGDLNVAVPFVDDAALPIDFTMNHPRSRSAQLEMSSTRYALDRALVEPIPNVSVQTGFNYVLERPHSQALLGFYFDVPIWNRNQGNIRAARGNLSAAAARYNLVQNELTAELAEAIGQYRSAAGRLHFYETGVLPDSQEGLQLVRDGYERGQFDVLRLLQAQKAFAEAELGRLAALQQRAQAAVEVIRLATW